MHPIAAGWRVVPHQRGSPHGQPGQPRAALEVGAVVEVVTRFAGWFVLRRGEKPGLSGRCQRFAEVFLDVGPDVQFTPRDERPADMPQERFTEDATLAAPG